MNDPLAAFRKKPTGLVQPPEPPKEQVEYVAFDTKDRVPRLKILRANYPGRSPNYSLLLDLVYSGEGVTQLVLVFTFMMVFVRGRNLRPVLTALEMGTADFIQEFDPQKWAKPKDANAPLIESIQVTLKESGPPIAETENSARLEPGRNLH